MAANAVLVGAVLTFASTDASQLQLTVTLSATAAVSLAWGDALTATITDGPHTFGPLPAPTDAPLEYRLTIGDAPALVHRVKPLGGSASAPLRMAIYGDTRGGTGPHQRLIAQMEKAQPGVVIHTGDVIRWAGDRTGWTEHLAAVLPISAEVPIVLALGNHEVWQYWREPGPQGMDPLLQAMAEIPPPDDAIAKQTGAAPASFHVRIGETLIVSIDSNLIVAPDCPVLRFLDRALEANADAKLKLVAMHHGPLSSGHHGPHPQWEALLAVAKKRGVDVFVAGHDHIYEHIVQDGLTVLISGGGGAPLYQRENFVAGSLLFSSTYNWVQLDAGATTEFTAYSLEGVVLERGRIPSDAKPHAEHALPLAALVGVVVFATFLWAVTRILRGKVR